MKPRTFLTIIETPKMKFAIIALGLISVVLLATGDAKTIEDRGTIYK